MYYCLISFKAYRLVGTCHVSKYSLQVPVSTGQVLILSKSVQGLKSPLKTYLFTWFLIRIFYASLAQQPILD